jgi:hypothetical protein
MFGDAIGLFTSERNADRKLTPWQQDAAFSSSLLFAPQLESMKDCKPAKSEIKWHFYGAHTKLEQKCFHPHDTSSVEEK